MKNGNNTPPVVDARMDDEENVPDVLDGLSEVSTERALQWAAENQTLAILGAFAVGVFLGVMLRD